MGQGGPKSRTRPAPAPTPKPAPAQPTKPSVKPKNTLEADNKPSNALAGMGTLGSVGKAMKAFSELMELLINLGDELDNMKYQQDSVKLKKKITKLQKKIETPVIAKKNIKTNLATKHEGRLVSYMYKALGIPEPKPTDIKLTIAPKKKGEKPKISTPKEVGVKHLMVHLSKNFGPWEPGRKRIVDGMRPQKGQKPKFFVGDVMFFRNKFKNEWTTGFVVATNGTSVFIKNNQYSSPKKMPAAQLVMGIHIPGNKSKGKIPNNPKKEKAKQT